MNRAWREEAKSFLEICDEFKLGDLPTEGPNPKTKGLSGLAKNNLPKAMELLKDVDLECLEILKKRFNLLENLQKDIRMTLNLGARVFLCGCGATGRLSLALERIFREKFKNSDQVISFMAGGDVALISSIEEFEDFSERGARQLLDLGFSKDDLLVGSSEGGETSWVIGAVLEASKISNQNPYFLYCNPDDILIDKVKRSKEMIKNKNIKKINLYCNPMALAGSTRMQASTILMFGIGLSLVFYDREFQSIKDEFSLFCDFFKKSNLLWLEDFIKEESHVYQRGEFCHYQTTGHLGISILTDTTERSPTFSLAPFENQMEPFNKPSLCYFSYSSIAENEKAWSELLGREPRCIEWIEVMEKTSINRIWGYHVNSKSHEERVKYLPKKENVFSITQEDNFLRLKFLTLEHKEKQFNEGGLYAHMHLKMILNIHSTLIMGRLDRYKCNIMTWVKSSNNKLVDRTARNIIYLLEEKGIEKSYEEIIFKIFENKKSLKDGESLVNKVVDFFSSHF